MTSQSKIPKLILGILYDIELGSAIDIANKSKIDKRTVEKHMKCLVELGLVISHSISKGKMNINVYKMAKEYVPIWKEVLENK